MDKLIEWLEEEGLTLGWLASELGIERVAPYAWKEVPWARVRPISELTGIPKEDLKEGY